jgi:hypothetical protein
MDLETARRAVALLCICASLSFSVAASAEPSLLAQIGGTPSRHHDAPPPNNDRPAPGNETPARNYATPAQDNDMVRRSLDEAIEHEKSRRAWAITGFAVGGVIVIGGLVYSAIDAQRKSNRTGKREYAVNWIGLGVGLPVLGVSAYVFIGAQKKLNRLRLQRARVALTPELDGGRISLALEF